MVKLTPIQIDESTVIYMEATEEVESPPSQTTPSQERVSKGTGSTGSQQQVLQNFQQIQQTIRTYTAYTLSAFRNLAVANVDEVVLQFGIEVGGEAGIPYVTKGTAKSNLNITVKCSFPRGADQEK
jgi:hypothetical protein